MKDFDKIRLSSSSTIRQAMQAIDAGAIKIGVVLEDDGRFTGTISDGDIRRGLLSGLSMESKIESIVNKNPLTAKISDDREILLQLALTRKLSQIPLLDENGYLKGIEVLDELLDPGERTNPVVLMAGGLGTRLGELTRSMPKPMLSVGGKPILETIILQFAKYGFRNIIISVNYLSHIIEDYFQDGKRFGVNIRYIHEEKRMGTAGALDLARDYLTDSFFVMNGDILTNVNFDHLRDVHLSSQSVATMCVREYDFQVPYGTVNISNGNILSIDEKPVHKFFVSAGIYMLSPAALEYVPRDTFYDMPTLFEKVISERKKAQSFLLREYWLDIGQIKDYEKANMEYGEFF